MFGLQLRIVDGEAIKRATKRRLHPRAEPVGETDEAHRQRLEGEMADDWAVNDASRYFMQSYRGMRFTIGVLAFALPWALILVDHFLLDDSPRRIRGSMSAYYHSSARDIFVGALFATGGFLVCYMRAKRLTYDYWLSSMAGVLIIVVAFFPTGREPNTAFTPASDSCTTFLGPPYCTGLQNTLSEDTVMLIHGICASLFVLMLVALSVVFAWREFGYGPAAADLCGRERSVPAVLAKLGSVQVSPLAYLLKGVPRHGKEAPRRRTLLYVVSTLVMVLAIVWKFLGVDVSVPGTTYHLAPLYVTEFVSFNAFGVAWMAAAWDLKVFHRAESGKVADVPVTQHPPQGLEAKPELAV